MNTNNSSSSFEKKAPTPNTQAADNVEVKKPRITPFAITIKTISSLSDKTSDAFEKPTSTTKPSIDKPSLSHLFNTAEGKQEDVVKLSLGSSNDSGTDSDDTKQRKKDLCTIKTFEAFASASESESECENLYQHPSKVSKMELSKEMGESLMPQMEAVSQEQIKASKVPFIGIETNTRPDHSRVSFETYQFY